MTFSSLVFIHGVIGWVVVVFCFYLLLFHFGILVCFFDQLCFQINEVIPIIRLKLSAFVCRHSKQKPRERGGLVFFIRKKINPEPVSLLKWRQAYLWIQLQEKNMLQILYLYSNQSWNKPVPFWTFLWYGFFRFLSFLGSFFWGLSFFIN